MSETFEIRPRYAGVTFGGWVTFSHVMSLAEDAVLQWFRDSGYEPMALYHDHGVCLSVIDASVLMPGLLSMDEKVTAQVTPVGGRYYDVRLSTLRDGGSADILRGRLTVALLRERNGKASLPAGLSELALNEIAGLGTAVSSHDPRHEEQELAEAAAAGTLPGFLSSWRARYVACRFSSRMSLAGYLCALEEVVDDFLAAKDLHAGRLLAERGWMPAFARARVRLLGETVASETVHTTYSVAQVVRNSFFDGRAECHVKRGDRFVPTATGILLHGFARADGAQAGEIVRLDDATIAVVTGQ